MYVFNCVSIYIVLQYIHTPYSVLYYAVQGRQFNTLGKAYLTGEAFVCQIIL